MTRIHAFGRRSWLALLLGTQLIGAGVPLADARLDAAAETGLHVEARTERSCDPVHLHDDCVLCQHLSQRHLLSTPHAPRGTGIVREAAAPVPLGLCSIPTAPIERGRSPPTV